MSLEMVKGKGEGDRLSMFVIVDVCRIAECGSGCHAERGVSNLQVEDVCCFDVGGKLRRKARRGKQYRLAPTGTGNDYR